MAKPLENIQYLGDLAKPIELASGEQLQPEIDRRLVLLGCLCFGKTLKPDAWGVEEWKKVANVLASKHVPGLEVISPLEAAKKKPGAPNKTIELDTLLAFELYRRKDEKPNLSMSTIFLHISNDRSLPWHESGASDGTLRARFSGRVNNDSKDFAKGLAGLYLRTINVGSAAVNIGEFRDLALKHGSTLAALEHNAMIETKVGNR